MSRLRALRSTGDARRLVGVARARLALRVRARLDARRARRNAAAYSRYRTLPVDPGLVLYESFFGNGMLDNPEALFRHLLTRPDLRHLRHVWVLRSLDRHRDVVSEFAGRADVQFVQMHSRRYLRALATAGYLVNNQTFPQQFVKRRGQVYLNTWHGVPLKQMGYDMPGGGPHARNITRNLLAADYLLSANPFMTDVMWRGAYRLQGLYPGAVIEEGQPRTDRQAAASRDPGRVLRALADAGVGVGGRKVLLYAPTWRGPSFLDPDVNPAGLLDTVAELRAAVDPAQWVVLLKVHQSVYEPLRAAVGESDVLVPNSVPTNDVLGVTDLLVTDYSSIFFDFLGTGRPVVHYVPDIEEYDGHRGLYLRRTELPGSVVESVPALQEAVRRAIASGPRSARSDDAAARFCAKDDGQVCRRVADLVFRRDDESGYTVHRDFRDGRERLLMHLGAMKSMGITMSGLNLLRHLDYDRYDVTVFYRWSRGRDRTKNIHLVDPRARVLAYGDLHGAPTDVRREQRKMLVDGVGPQLTAEHRAFWSTEWRRMFGEAQFDQLVDFSGYGCYTPFLYSAAGGGRRSVWLHNDMMADAEQRVRGHKPQPHRQFAVFSTYRFFDALVSVSPQLREVNRRRLAAYAAPEAFRSVVNTIDGERVLRMSDEEPTPYDPSAEPGTTTFVSVGRLSVEKNHARLVRAFARLHKDYPRTRLVMMGTGELAGDLTALVGSLGLDSAVVLTGLVDNPYAIMARSDCFVLSSDYEGQPMVILEARTLGLPVVATAFDSATDSVPPESGVIVPASDEGLAGGMAAFLRGEVPSSRLDVERYNAEAVRQLTAVLAGAADGDPADASADAAADTARDPLTKHRP